MTLSSGRCGKNGVWYFTIHVVHAADGVFAGTAARCKETAASHSMLQAFGSLPNLLAGYMSLQAILMAMY